MSESLGTYYNVTFDPENALPAEARKTLARHQDGYLRKHCYAARHASSVDYVETDGRVWTRVDVTMTETRFMVDRKWYAIPTPPVVSAMIPRHDKGLKLRKFTVNFDVTKAVPVAKTAGKSRVSEDRKRHDVDASGELRERKPRPGRNSYSRECFTRPHFA